MQRGKDVTEYAFLRDFRLNQVLHLNRTVKIKKTHPKGCAFFIKIHFLITSLVLPSLVQPLVQLP